MICNAMIYRIILILVFLSVIPAAKASPLYISEVSRLDFAVLEIPSRGRRQHIEIPPDGRGYKGNGEVLSGMPQRGEYFITGPFTEHPQTISINIENVVTGSSELQLDKFKGIYDNRHIGNFPVWGLPSPGAGGKTLFLGARLEYTSNIAEGTYHPSYNIVIVYE